MEDNQTVGTPEIVEGQEQTRTYSQEEVNKLLQQEADRRVSMALKKEQAKFRAQMDEAEKLRVMNDEQKAQYQLEQRIKEIEAKERDFAIRENRYEAQKIMAEKNIPLSFADFIVADDAETMMANISLFEQEFRNAVRVEVDKRLASQTPKANIGVAKGITKEQFKKMNLAQQSELYHQDPELYRTLTQR
jgi:hypothetical protein